MSEGDFISILFAPPKYVAATRTHGTGRDHVSGADVEITGQKLLSNLESSWYLICYEVRAFKKTTPFPSCSGCLGGLVLLADLTYLHQCIMLSRLVCHSRGSTHPL